MVPLAINPANPGQLAFAAVGNLYGEPDIFITTSNDGGNTWSQFVATGCATSAPPNFTMKYDCTASSGDIQNYVQSLATGGINPSNITVNSNNWPGTTPDGAACSQANAQGCLVKVTVSYTYSFLSFLPMHPLSMSATSETAILQ